MPTKEVEELGVRQLEGGDGRPVTPVFASSSGRCWCNDAVDVDDMVAFEDSRGSGEDEGGGWESREDRDELATGGLGGGFTGCIVGDGDAVSGGEMG